MSPLALELTKLIGKKEYGIGLIFRQAYTKEIETMVSEVRGGNFHAMIGDEIHFPHTSQITEIIGHPATLTDLHRWMNENYICWRQFGYESVDGDAIWIADKELPIQYNTNKELLEQSPETLQQILELIKSNS